MQKGRVRRLSERAGRNASERRAGLETVNVGADPPIIRGRPLRVGEEPSDRRPISPTGVLATACMTRNPTGTREAHTVRGVTSTGIPRGTGRAAVGDGAARSSDEAGERRRSEGAVVQDQRTKGQE